MDTGGNNISETSLTGAMQSEYVFFGKRVGRHDANGSLFFYFSDHLGSTNIVANSMGVIQSESDFYREDSATRLLCMALREFELLANRQLCTDPQPEVRDCLLFLKYLVHACGHGLLPSLW